MMRSNTPTSVGNDAEWQRLWFTLQGRPWTALAVVDTTGGSDAEAVARALAEVGNRDGQVPVECVFARGKTFKDVPHLVTRLSEASAKALRLVACDSLGENPAMIPLLQAADAAVVVVRLGQATTAAVDKTVEVIGRHKVLASVSIG